MPDRPDVYRLVCEDCDRRAEEEHLTTARELVRGHNEVHGCEARLEVPLDEA